MRPAFRRRQPVPGQRWRLAVVAGLLACTEGTGTPDPRGLDRLVITPASLTLLVGQTGKLEAEAWAGDSRVSVPALTWSTANSAVATVSAQGLVTANGVGTATITASTGTVSGSALVAVTPPGPTGAVVEVYPSVQYQVMTGWEAVAQAGELECNPTAFQAYRTPLFDAAVDDLGLNRLRLELRSGAEHPVDAFTRFRAGQISEAAYRNSWFDAVNDNSNPQSINAAGFQWSHLDYTVDNVVTPVRQRLQARGEQLYVNLNYVDFDDSPFEHSANPQEYAELILAAFQHLQSKYGWVPDAVEIILEPDNTSNWRASTIGPAIVATGDRLAGAGFHPHFIAPSTTSTPAAVAWFDDLIRIPRVTDYLTDLSYHRYSGFSPAALQAIGDRSAQYGVRTGMLEHIGSDYHDLHADLLVGRNSSWQQFALAFCETADNGAQYFTIDQSNPSAPVLREGYRTRFLKHYFRHVRLGATRIGAVSGDSRFSPVAFRNVDGRIVVVVTTESTASFELRGLPAGTYGTFWTTPTLRGTAPDASVGASGTMTVQTFPGVVTVFRR